jgi:hypothetical protein
MDTNTSFFFQTQTEMQEDNVENDWEMAASAVAAIWLGAEEARILRAERRQQSRLYLCRAQIPGSTPLGRSFMPVTVIVHSSRRWDLTSIHLPA